MTLFFFYVYFRGAGSDLSSVPTNAPGFHVPNMEKYYQSTQLTLPQATSDFPLWLLLKRANCAPIPVSALLRLSHKLCPLMRHSLKLWDSVHYSGNLMSPFILLLLLFNNPPFPPGFAQPGSFSCWLTYGFTEVCHFLSFHTFTCWTSLQETHEAPPVEFFLLCPTAPLGVFAETQLLLPIPKNCFQTHLPSLFWLPRIYFYLNAIDPPAVMSYNLRWERDLAISIDPEKLSKAWSPLPSSPSTQLP